MQHFLRFPCPGQGTGQDVFELPSHSKADEAMERQQRGDMRPGGEGGTVRRGWQRSLGEATCSGSLFPFLVDEKCIVLCCQRTNRILTCILHFT